MDNFANSIIENSFNFHFSGSDASDSDERPTYSSLGSLGVGILAVTITFEALVDGCDVRDAWRFTGPTVLLWGGGIAFSAGSYSERLPFAFMARSALGGAFVGPLCVSTLPLGETFFFNGACSRSLALEVELSLELDCLPTTICFPASAFFPSLSPSCFILLFFLFLLLLASRSQRRLVRAFGNDQSWRRSTRRTRHYSFAQVD